MRWYGCCGGLGSLLEAWARQAAGQPNADGDSGDSTKKSCVEPGGQLACLVSPEMQLLVLFLLILSLLVRHLSFLPSRIYSFSIKNFRLR